VRVRYFCHHGSIGGYGRAARDYLAALAQHGGDDLELEIVSLDHDDKSPEARDAELDHFVVGTIRSLQFAGDLALAPPDVAVVHASPRVLETLRQTGALSACYPARFVALTTWETSILPDRFARVLEDYEAVITPSGFCQDAIGSLACPVHVVPHCFDEEYWEALNPRRFDPEDASRKVRFYTMGVWGERKNVLGVVKAYLHAFTRSDRVQLLVQLSELAGKVDFDDIRSLVACSGIPADELPEIAIPEPRVLSEYEVLALHSEADCYVSTTRGEGFGLPIFEAAVMGNEVIAPLWGGQSDFLLEYPHLRQVPHQLVPCFGAEIRDRVVDHGADRMAVSRIQLPPGVNAKQLWADPDLSIVAAHMRLVYEDAQKADFHLRDRSSVRAAFAARFGYHIVGPKLATLLRGIACPETLSSSTSNP
jgi:glycosyltransferase involved in cell wall biosynthesis